MSIDIIVRHASAGSLSKLKELFKGHWYWIDVNHKVLLIRETSFPNNDTTTYYNLSEDDLATLEFLPDFDTRYTYLLSLSLGINA